MLDPQGGEFTCHKFIDQPNKAHCTGALIFAEKQGAATQMMRIADRLGIYHPAEIMTPEAEAEIFDDVDEMTQANAEAEAELTRPRPKSRRRKGNQ